MTICRTQIYCNFGPLLFNCNLAMQIWYWKIAAIWTLNKNMSTQCKNWKLVAFWTLNKCMAKQQHQFLFSSIFSIDTKNSMSEFMPIFLYWWLNHQQIIFGQAPCLSRFSSMCERWLIYLYLKRIYETLTWLLWYFCL